MKILKNIKPLEVTDDYFIGSVGYKIYKYYFASRKKELLGRVIDFKNSLASSFFLTRRLFRSEITNLYTLSNGDRLLIAKKGVFRCSKGTKRFIKCFDVKRGSRPMNMVITPNDHIYFGEYFSNMKKGSVNIYCSEDGGKTWNIAYTFEEGNINHIHGLFWDSYTDKIWIATGDRDNECIIGNTDDGFKTLNIVLRGGQEYRTTNLLFYKDYIIFATDSQYIKNEIRKIDRRTLKIETLQEIQGSCIYAGQCGSYSYLSTTVEPSEMNQDQNSYVWVSDDGISWRQLYFSHHDIWSLRYFQYASILFPNHIGSLKHFMFYGRAVKKIGGNAVLMDNIM